VKHSFFREKNETLIENKVKVGSLHENTKLRKYEAKETFIKI
jgi:hypothetical protein